MPKIRVGGRSTGLARTTAPRPGGRRTQDLQRMSHATQLALLAAYARQDAAGRRTIVDAAEAVARGSDRPSLAIAADRFLQAAR